MVQPQRFRQPMRGSAEPIMMPRGFTPSAEPMRPPRGYYPPAQLQPAPPMPVYRGSAEPMMAPFLFSGSAEPMMAPMAPQGPRGMPMLPKLEIGGVGVVFMDQIDQRGVNEVVVKKVYPNSPADRAVAPGGQKIAAGDVLSDVNGEDVYMRSSKEIHKLIPGKVGSTVILGFRSADDPTVYYEVECVREMTRLGEMTLDQIARENQPQPGSAEPLDQDDLYDIKPVGPQASPGFSLQKDDDLAGAFIVANVTPGSSAEQCGFQHGEIVEAIDNISVEGWSERRILKMLTGPYRTLVQVHTNMRVVPVVRDCRSIFDPPRPPPPPMPVMERIVPIERYVVTEKLVPVERPMMMPQQPMMMPQQPLIMQSAPVQFGQPPMIFGSAFPGLGPGPAPMIIQGGPVPASVPPMMQGQPMMQPFQQGPVPPPPGPPMHQPMNQGPPPPPPQHQQQGQSGNYFQAPASPPQTSNGFPGVYSTLDGNDGFL